MAKYVTLYVKASLMLVEHKAGFRREGHICLGNIFQVSFPVFYMPDLETYNSEIDTDVVMKSFWLINL